MSDWLANTASSPLGARLLKALGLPQPVILPRSNGAYEARPLAGKRVLLGAFAKTGATAALRSGLAALGAEDGEGKLDGVVYDATAIAGPADLDGLFRFFQPLVRRLNRGAHVLVAARDEGYAARGVEGFVRSLGKEVGRYGATANLVTLAPGAEDRLAGVLPFFCTPRCAYVSGQVLHVDARVAAVASQPRAALVTGAARGIGQAVARRLALEGLHVFCLDMPGEALQLTAAEVGGTPIGLDVAAADAPERLIAALGGRGLDVVVHNAGITRDKTLANMDLARWQQVLAVNLQAIVALDEAFLAQGVLRDGGRVVCLSSVSGIAGNFGQTNYATTKAALIGYVAERAGQTAARGITYNAVAPGFIETPMTDAIPFLTREIGRRLNALSQGGRPADVAEAIAFLASAPSLGVTGQTLRVCGQALIGA